MTVAPSACLDRPTYEAIMQGLRDCHRLGSRPGRWSRHPDAPPFPIASLCFPIPWVDPLAALLALAPAGEPQCYWESPARRQAIAAWGTLLSQEVSGSDRFHQTQQHLYAWQQRLYRPETLLGPGPYFFNSYTFFPEAAPPQPEWGPPLAPSTLVLCPWQVVSHQGQSWIIANVSLKLGLKGSLNANLGRESALESLARHLHEQIGRILQGGRRPLRSRSIPTPLPTPPAPHFRQRVETALAAIAQGILRKQVVAHTLELVASQPWQRGEALYRLRLQNPDCFIFSFGTGSGVHFIGASPERLLSIHQGRLIVDALAGSAPRGATPREDDLLAQALLTSPKEQQEHCLVVESIVEHLRSRGVQPRYGTPPGLLRLSHIQHLHTPIGGEMPPGLSPLDLVAALHPTPAVAGVPTAIACEQIRCSEGGGDGRGPYAAPLGWIDAQGNSEFIVGIRSALVRGQRARLFAGAGIVAGSDPDREVAEIQLKLQALLQALV